MSKSKEKTSVAKVTDVDKIEDNTIVELTNKVSLLEEKNKQILVQFNSLSKENELLKTENISLKETIELVTAENNNFKEVRQLEDVNEKLTESKEDYIKNRKVFKAKNGKFYAFKYDTPKNLRVNGGVKSQKELIADSSLLEDLIFGNSYFIEEVKK